jgi:uncharacterized protein YhaN
MKLLRCYIENFGTLSKFSHGFSDGLNVLYKENGFGKSTLAAFIRAMFYGLPYSVKKDLEENDRKMYTPWQGGKFGGSIEFKLKNKGYKIERFFGLREKDDGFKLFDLDTGKESGDFSENIGEEIFKLNAEGYDRSTYFLQKNLSWQINNSISAGLSNLVENTDDISNFDTALKRLEDRRREYEKTGNRGKIADIENKIIETESKITECLESMQSIANYKSRIAEKNVLLKKFENELKELKKQSETAAQPAAGLSAAVASESHGNIKPVNIGLMRLAAFIIFAAVGGCGILLLSIGNYFGIAFIVVGVLVFLGLFQILKSEGAAQRTRQAQELQRSRQESAHIGIADFLERFDKNAKEVDNIKDERARLEARIVSLSETADMLFEYENEKEALRQNLKEAVYSLKVINFAKDFLKKAKENISVGYLGVMRENFLSYARLFDPEFFKNFTLDTDLNVSVEISGENKTKENLSKGYKDIIEIITRLALTDALFKHKDKPFIILDDPFVNLDNKKLQAAQGLIRLAAKDYQIVHLICHDCRA